MISATACLLLLTVTLPEMVEVPPGKFTMGQRDVRPFHEVTITREYALARDETSEAEIAEFGRALIGDGRAEMRGRCLVWRDGEVVLLTIEESHFPWGLRLDADGGIVASAPDHPAVGITWYGAIAYCNWLTEATGEVPLYDVRTGRVVGGDAQRSRCYRLPTEAEWEWGAGYPGDRENPWGKRPDRLAYNFDANYLYPRGHYSPAGDSELGIRDQIASVWEWVVDVPAAYTADPVVDPVHVEMDASSLRGPRARVNELRVIRGGSNWSAIPMSVALRGYRQARMSGFDIGVRVARSVED